jgi:methylmalonyl-CoA/ethylmalonyl-CoA epimerase
VSPTSLGNTDATMHYLEFHHFGLAVRKEDAALKFLSATGYTHGTRIYDPEQNANVRLCVSPIMPDVELVTPGIGPGPLDSILKRGPEMIYHLCYQTSDLNGVLESFKVKEIRHLCVSPRKPAILFNNRFVSFYHLPGFGLIELLEMDSN